MLSTAESLPIILYGQICSSFLVAQLLGYGGSAPLPSVYRLPTEEQKVLELTQLAGLEIREDIFIILWELMQLDAPPMLVLQLLRQMAGISSEDVPSSSASFKFQDGGRTLPGRSN